MSQASITEVCLCFFCPVIIIINLNVYFCRYDPKSDKNYPSTFQFKASQVSTLGAIFIAILRFFRLVQYKKVPDTPDTYESSNLTIINLMLVWFGPMNERNLTLVLIFIQCLCSLVAFFIRYGVSRLFY